MADLKNLALIPARSGSLRVKDKNIRPLLGHPLLAYTIAAARQAGLYARVVVSTNSELFQDIARHYGAEAPFLRPAEFATSTSPDIEWLAHALGALGEPFDTFSILRPTSPLRLPATIRRAMARFVSLPGIDSLRAVQLVKEHPGKMWVVEGERIRPLLDQDHLGVPWHARQYQDCPQVYVQNSSLEMAWARVVPETHSREGRVVAPFFTDACEGFAVDYESDFELLEKWVAEGRCALPPVEASPYPLP
ncbi:MAG: acylneuraminate cytidylyltransferase family protein [Deltaproteobacteria bacterium]|nr:acylneuraminate cytidylyltransferase family protein [Deltaproteobacteria bacterium]